MTTKPNSTISTMRTLALLGALILLAQPIAAAAGCLLQGMDMAVCSHCEDAKAPNHSHSTPLPERPSGCCDIDRNEPATQSTSLKTTAKKEFLVLVGAELTRTPACPESSVNEFSAQEVLATAYTQAQLCSFRN